MPARGRSDRVSAGAVLLHAISAHPMPYRGFALPRPAPEPNAAAARSATAGKFAWVSFDVSADAYLRFMGRYSEPLAAQFADLAGVGRGQRVLDVGCGPGALTAELVSRAGAARSVRWNRRPRSPRRCGNGCPGWMSGRPRPSSCRSPTAPSTPRWRSWSFISWPTRCWACGRWAGSPGPAGWSRPACGTTRAAAGRWPRSGPRCASWIRPPTTSRAWPVSAKVTWPGCSRRPG